MISSKRPSLTRRFATEVAAHTGAYHAQLQEPGNIVAVYTAGGQKLYMIDRRTNRLDIVKAQLSRREELYEIRSQVVGLHDLGGGHGAGDRHQPMLQGLRDDTFIRVGEMINWAPALVEMSTCCAESTVPVPNSILRPDAAELLERIRSFLRGLGITLVKRDFQ